MQDALPTFINSAPSKLTSRLDVSEQTILGRQTGRELTGKLRRPVNSSTRRPLPLESFKVLSAAYNPFYDSSAIPSLGAAATQIHVFISAGLQASQSWAAMSQDDFLDVSNDQIDNFTKDITNIATFLEYGRQADGWKLYDLPHNFFDNLRTMLPDLLSNLNKIVEFKGGWRLQKALERAQVIQKRLTGVQAVRLSIEKGEYAKKEVGERAKREEGKESGGA